MAQKSFGELKTRIVNAIDQQLQRSPIAGEPDGVTLIEGFFTLPLTQETGGGSIVLGGPVVPMVALLGKTTGKLHFYALKVLIPDLES